MLRWYIIVSRFGYMSFMYFVSNTDPRRGFFIFGLCKISKFPKYPTSFSKTCNNTWTKIKLFIFGSIFNHLSFSLLQQQIWFPSQINLVRITCNIHQRDIVIILLWDQILYHWCTRVVLVIFSLLLFNLL
ncbi:MAG: hypothetical protein Ta2E_00790 [Mycoplasmoidaceae bacterium]|nr:MAG: hypothetical protein Ta2E_00790 [Mycoplasmoidaceae bacterium]